ncbi:hypothetical protein GGX14DRAFT_309340, partial [Mycena pura]
LPPIIDCQLYHALIDCHLTHGCDLIVDVDPVSFALLDDLNHTVLRRILGLGKHSGLPQLYSELGVYPLLVRRLELALRYLAYLLALPSTHLAHKALQDADALRSHGSSSWLGDLAYVVRNLP